MSYGGGDGGRVIGALLQTVTGITASDDVRGAIGWRGMGGRMEDIFRQTKDR